MRKSTGNTLQMVQQIGSSKTLGKRSGGDEIMTNSTELDISTGVLMGLIISAFVIWLSYKRTNGQEAEKHIWRPALTSRGPARTCICGVTEDITTEEFYAQFGIMPNIGIIGR